MSRGGGGRGLLSSASSSRSSVAARAVQIAGTMLSGPVRRGRRGGGPRGKGRDDAALHTRHSCVRRHTPPTAANAGTSAWMAATAAAARCDVIPGGASRPCRSAAEAGLHAVGHIGDHGGGPSARMGLTHRMNGRSRCRRNA
eukprot:364647-Chlamydomonas_euryale.AAC.25